MFKVKMRHSLFFERKYGWMEPHVIFRFLPLLVIGNFIIDTSWQLLVIIDRTATLVFLKSSDL